MRDYVEPGTSALFPIVEHATPDKAIAALQQYGGTVIKTSLSDEDTAKLQEALQPRAVRGGGTWVPYQTGLDATPSRVIELGRATMAREPITDPPRAPGLRALLG